MNVNALPQPGNSYRDGYDVIIEFSSALNLPDRAKVVLDGSTVGVVTKVALSARQVDVTARLGSGVVVPANIHAALQQATVLGDIYVALQRSQTDQSAAPPIAAGGTIPLAQTTSPPQLEDTIATLANFVSSGSIQRIQNTIIGINRVQPPGGQAAIRKVASQVAADLSDLSSNIGTVDQLLNNASGTGEIMDKLRPIYADWFTPNGTEAFYRAGVTGEGIATVVPSLGSIYAGGFWLVPLLHSLVDATGALQRSKWDFEEEAPAWRRLFTDKFIAQDRYPAINITSIVGPDGKELSGDVQDVLRILGAAP
ncbi:mammalian cell entry protein [Mycobacterium arosiense ATCC BAA-1401 = DSM 45069]|uniref:Mammalian cell entry protein n=1 Tax=Mycobacterium arosiense ATCC BAA-1401 = DSM 45069 TaxID=1265311 RepID=A0A1W9ZBE4_MYCAI|nr:mammalian cell entry protein [Mycobacterium arosiense ATCC BAA-1401 = DSM 45069]